MLWRQNFSDTVQDSIACGPSTARAGGGPNDRGIALVITLLLLFLLSVMGLVAVLSTSSDMLINGYYNNYRGSFYAADSGLSIARQAIYNQLNQKFTTDFTTFPALPPSDLLTEGTAVQTYINTNYGSSQILSGPGSTNGTVAASSWSESFKITSVSLTLAPGYPTVTAPTVSPTQYGYLYNYALTSVGSARGSEQSTIVENGSFIINVSGTPSTWNPSFAYWGAFITNYPPCLGPLVPGTMTGPMFTNGAWGFMTGGTYIFTDPVGQANANASYWVNWNCYQSPASSFTANGQTIAPQFQAGFQVGQSPIPQPANSYSQKWAAVDGMGVGETNPNPTNADLHASLKTVSGTPYPTSGATSGVYLNYQTVSGSPTMFDPVQYAGGTKFGGGLYVEGDAQISLSTSGSSAQVVTIKQGSTTTTMTVDPVANTTVVTSGGNTLTLIGVPTNVSKTPPQAGTMVYVNGKITSLSGPGQGVGAIQDGAAITITALNDIDITGDVIYKTEPVTMTQNQIPGTPVATLIPGSNHNQDLGIFTANGNIVLSSPYANTNLQVDGSQAAIGGSCASSSCGFLVNGCINTFNNVGGQIQTNIFAACMNTQNTYYDRRYSTVPGFAPPWFPATTVTNIGATVTSPPMITPQRTNWISSSGQ
jgi:Tfp pilus assembly protein PilX